MVERFNRTLKDMVAKYIKPCGSDWDEHVTSLAFAYNTSKHSVTGYSPFFLVHGREARLPVDELFHTKQNAVEINSHVENILRKLKVAFGKVEENMDKAAQEMVRQQQGDCRETRYYAGQKVWVTDHTAHAGGKRKLELYFKGPGTIIRLDGPDENGVVYQIEMPGGKRVKMHHNHLKPVRGHLLEQHPSVSHSEKDAAVADEAEPREILTRPETLNSTKEDQNEEREPCYITRYGRKVKPVQPYQA